MLKLGNSKTVRNLAAPHELVARSSPNNLESIEVSELTQNQPKIFLYKGRTTHYNEVADRPTLL